MNQKLRPPAAPLITADPFFSVWSFTDTLTGDTTRHWTGASNSLIGLIRIDGCVWRFLGLESEDRSLRIGEVPAMPQKSLDVTATRTIYVFATDTVRLEVCFAAPLLLDDLMVASRPVNYLTLTLTALDGRAHEAAVYLDITGELCADRIEKATITGRQENLDGRPSVCLFNKAPTQPPLTISGDDQRIDWGSVYLVALDPRAEARVGTANLRPAFAAEGRLDPASATCHPRWPEESAPLVGAVTARLDLPSGSAASPATAVTAFIYAYDDEQKSINYFGKPAPAYCFKDGASFYDMLKLAVKDYPGLLKRCAAFDRQLADGCVKAGGSQYAAIAALAYRQAVAAHKMIADETGAVIFLSKECFSNGCIGTVDVSYPSTPLFLALCPELVRGMLRPIFRFAASPDWPYDFAPHDVGQYPLATGQVYGLDREHYDLKYQMPVEECGNMLIMTAAACRADGDFSLARDRRTLLEGWAGYLLKYGQDPGEQLCTDDFAGHLSHNANLSIKAIVGLGAYALILEALGEPEAAGTYRRAAVSMAGQWLALADDGDHTRLTFDKPGTWSMKYNLLFDRLLGLGLFPDRLYKEETAAYLKRQYRYGLPLDSRSAYTKSDWLIWCAALSDDQDQIRSLIEPLFTYYCETGSRMPLTDWYDTKTGQALHFRARSVVGGFFALLLSSLWLKGAE